MCFVRPQISSAPLTSLSLTGLHKPDHEFSCSLQIWSPTQWARLPSQLVPLSSASALPHPVLNLRHFTSLTACRIIQASQSHTPRRNLGYTTHLLLQSLPPTAPACSLYSLVQSPCDFTWSPCPPSPMCECVSKKQFPVSPVQC